MAQTTLRLGLISDTHGLLRPEAGRLLEGADHIIHAGDIGDPAVLAALSRIAAVTAVRGNNDTGSWAKAIPATQRLTLGNVQIFVIHDLAELDFDPAAEGLHAIVSGHSHKPRTFEKEGVLYVNPGSAGPRRFTLPVSLGWLEICGARIRAELREIPAAKGRGVATEA